jgi:hypothetical protein
MYVCFSTAFFLNKNFILLTFLSRRVRSEGHVACTGEKRNAYRVLVGKSEGKRPLGRSRHRWKDKIKMGWDGMDQIHLTQDRDQWWALENLAIKSSGSIKCWEILK